MSAPHLHAASLQALVKSLLAPGCVALDIGCGTGYLTAAMGCMVHGSRGTVWGVDVSEALVGLARSNCKHSHPDLSEMCGRDSPTLLFCVADVASVTANMGLRRGAAAGGAIPDNFPTQFDAIAVGVELDSTKAVEGLARLLRPGGQMVVGLQSRTGGGKMVRVDRWSTVKDVRAHSTGAANPFQGPCTGSSAAATHPPQVMEGLCSVVHATRETRPTTSCRSSTTHHGNTHRGAEGGETRSECKVGCLRRDTLNIGGDPLRDWTVTDLYEGAGFSPYVEG